MTLNEHQLKRIQNEAARALREAGALGIFPTPVEEIMRVARVQEVQEDVLNSDAGFLTKLRMEVGSALKRALGKVMGLFDARSSLVFIDRQIHKVKQTFVRLHEAAHGFLPWQRPMYAVVEDCESALDPNVAEAFDQEANYFASEVLFQGDSFIDEASATGFSIYAPINLSKKYGASIYASIRQYVSKNDKCCAVLVLDRPVITPGAGFKANLRRPIHSKSFGQIFQTQNWPDVFTPDDQIGSMVPVGAKQKASKPRSITLSDSNGDEHECVAEAFTQGYQVFILIHTISKLGARKIFLPPLMDGTR